MNLLKAAQWYASVMRWPVAPAHNIKTDGQCSCGKAGCGSPGKHPRTEHGHHDASSDLAVIGRWWADYGNHPPRTGPIASFRGGSCSVGL